MGLNNAAISRILFNPICFINIKFLFLFIFVLSLILNIFNNTSLPDEKYRYLISDFKFGLRINQRLYPNLG